MSAEPMMDTDFASIDKIFKARDAKYAREAAQRRPESRAAERAGYVPAQRNASRAGTRGGKRLEQPRRTRLEDMPERDEFRLQRRAPETERPQRSTQRPAQRPAQRNRGGAHLETSGNRTVQNTRNARKKGGKSSKAGSIATGFAGVGSALIVLLNALFSSAPAQAPADNTQKAESDAYAIHYRVETIEDNDTVNINGSEYQIEYDKEETPVDETADIPLDAVGETPVPEETPPPYVPIEHVSDNVIDAMKTFEGLYLEAYTCPGGALTIGYGHTAGVYEGQTITAQEAKDLLRSDLASREAHVSARAQEQGVQLTQGQFDALVDFAFNLGIGAFDESGLLEMIGEGDIDGAAARMQEYVYAKDKEGNKVKLGGLVARRAAEAEWLYS